MGEYFRGSLDYNCPLKRQFVTPVCNMLLECKTHQRLVIQQLTRIIRECEEIGRQKKPPLLQTC